MSFTPYFLDQALQSLASVTQAALYQDPTRAAASVSGNTSGVFTITPSTAFPLVPGVAITIASSSLPAVLSGFAQLYIRPTTTPGQFNVFGTLADALSNTGMLVPTASFTGTAYDVDLDNQKSLSALQAYELSFAGYARHTANYATGTVPGDGAVTRTSPYTLTNSSLTAGVISHVIAFSGSNLIGTAKLASLATVPANSTLVVTTSVTAAP